MSRNRCFIRRRDGRIEVRLSEPGREFVRSRFLALQMAQDDGEHAWHASLQQPIDPSRDDDDPLRIFERQKANASNAELALLTVDDNFLNDSEAWAWLRSLQLALRAVAVDGGLTTDDALSSANPDELIEIHMLQQLLFEMADVLS